ncbi:poly(A)-specific ribonuclease PARN-like isoform X2 [Impatiens glandulifera]|uniref:poly(A)-specific ribonuclease PARN-like isoform X2 n=1 Tax=Impatiens glandulifera TaxID=253017 RepID=UPI001FB15E0E|nr:poly(A)-specific ribonuclease PARN-like isoform X2 [Impatiens glandulifera]
MLLGKLQKRFLCTYAAAAANQSRRQWPTVLQVTKTNFTEALQQLEDHVHSSDFISVSLRNTGSYSSSWHRLLPIDTSDTAYFKAKYAADRFQVLQFAVCPISVRSSKLISHPYNFHLFPRDVLNLGMPSYTFSCQPSYLTPMAQEGFDFNACIYDGITYLSREQESLSREKIGNLVPSDYMANSISTPSVADSIFSERIRSRVKNWRKAFNDDSCTKKTEVAEALIKSLQKLMLGSGEYSSRPCLSIDVCSDRQVQLILEVLGEFNDFVPMIVPAKGGGAQAVRIVLTSSEEDKILFEKELQSQEKEQNKHVRGFREVIDLISTSEKPIIAHNSLNDFSFIYSKFIASLPPTFDKFKSSLLLNFPYVVDVGHLMKEVRRHLYTTPDMEISRGGDGKTLGLGSNAVRIGEIFAKICSVMKVNPESLGKSKDGGLKSYVNNFDNRRTVSVKDLVFIWGFKKGTSAQLLKKILCNSSFSSHDEEAFSDIRLLDKSCAVVAFSKPGSSECFLKAMHSSGGLLSAASYGTYSKACQMGMWEVDLADALDRAVMLDGHDLSGTHLDDPSEIIWDDDLMIDLDDL